MVKHTLMYVFTILRGVIVFLQPFLNNAAGSATGTLCTTNCHVGCVGTNFGTTNILG